MHKLEDRKILDQLYLICDRVSHLSRTQIGVVKGVIDDLVQGISLEQQDYQDAKVALGKLIKIIDSLKEFARPIEFSPEEITVEELMQGFVEVLREVGFEVKVEIDDPERIVEVDSNLLNRAVGALGRYLKEFFEAGQNAEMVFKLKSKNCLLQLKPFKNFHNIKGRVGLAEFLKLDPSSGSLVVVFVVNVFGVVGWECKVEVET